MLEAILAARAAHSGIDLAPELRKDVPCMACGHAYRPEVHPVTGEPIRDELGLAICGSCQSLIQEVPQAPDVWDSEDPLLGGEPNNLPANPPGPVNPTPAPRGFFGGWGRR